MCYDRFLNQDRNRLILATSPEGKGAASIPVVAAEGRIASGSVSAWCAGYGDHIGRSR